MNLSTLEAYEDSEREYVRSVGAKAAPNGYVSEGSRIYSDQGLPKRLGFHRHGAPLNALVFLYESTVVYVPPTTKHRIEMRLGMDWDDFVSLSHSRQVQPVIGHPSHYARRPHFDALFEVRPPSVWARGDELAHSFAGARDYWAKAMTDVPAEAMAKVPWLRNKFQRHFPSLRGVALEERIAVEIRTNYVDLCIYGFEPLAQELASALDLSWSARRILEISELITYPTLMGMGGMPNYGLEDATAIECASQGFLLTGSTRTRTLGPELSILTTGLNLTVPDHVSAHTVEQFHGDGMSDRLWKALAALETRVAQSVQDPDDLSEVSETAATIVRESLTEIADAPSRLDRRRYSGRVHHATDFTVKMGSAAALTVATHSVLGLDWGQSLLGGAGLAQTLWSLAGFQGSLAETDRKVGDMLARRRAGELATQLWWLSDWRKKNPHVS